MHSFSLLYVNACKEVNLLGDKWRQYLYRAQLEELVISRLSSWSLNMQSLCLTAIYSTLTKLLVGATLTGNRKSSQDQN